MTNPDEQQENTQRDNFHDWQRRHYGVQRTIAIGGILGLCILVMQWYQMRTALRTDQRAWIEPTMQEAIIEIGKPFQAHLGISNTGKTPARKVTVQSVIQLAVKGGMPDYGLIEKESGDNSEYSRMIVYPNAHYSAITAAKWGALTQAHVDQLKSGDLRVYCFGRISYEDIFGNAHYSMFSTAFQPESGNFRYWRDGNTSDD